MDSITAKERLSSILLHPEGRPFSIAVLYIVYKTIEANDNITLYKLKRLLSSDLMIADSVINGAVASLSSKSVFNVVNKWTKPKTDSTNEVVHLRLYRETNTEFQTWLTSATHEFPELVSFTPSTLSR
jgi:hypothetical protein